MTSTQFDYKNYSGLLSAKLIVDLLCFLSTPMMILYGVKSFYAGHEAYGLSLFVMAMMVSASFGLYKFYGAWRLHRNIISVMFTVFYFYLLITGGENGSGIFWLYGYPLLAFAILGMHYGTLLMAAILSVTACVLFIPDWLGIDLVYPMNTRIRFIGSIVFVTLMAYTMERARVIASQSHQRASDALKELARTDELTGLLNRRGMSERVSQELIRSVRDDQEMSVVLCDVDFFKKVNDQYGHDVGDQVLIRLADKLQATVRGSDSVGRWGGEEFLILLPNTSVEKAYQLVERIRLSIARQDYQFHGANFNISISCGLASTKFSRDMRTLLKAADISLYEAKEQGRNCTRPIVSEAS